MFLNIQEEGLIFILLSTHKSLILSTTLLTH